MFRLTRLAERCRGVGQVLRDPLRKPLSQMVREAADVARRTGAYPEWYFLSFVYRRDAGPYAEYLVRDQYQKLKVLEQDELYALLDDKLRFHERFRDTDCVLPRLLAHNEGCVFHLGETVRDVSDSSRLCRPDGRVAGALHKREHISKAGRRNARASLPTGRRREHRSRPSCTR